MASNALATVLKMLESLPETDQEKVADHLREYLEDMKADLQWDELIKSTQPQLAAAARRAKKEIASGQAKPMGLEQL